MKENQFIVDLGNLKISDDQRKRINAAINSAVTGELAKIDLTRRIVIIPVNRWPRGPILNGIIARLVDQNQLQNIANLG